MLQLVLVQLALAAPCADDTAVDLDTALAQSDAALAALDADGLVQASSVIREALQCVDEPLTRSLAARVHRAQGLASFITGDELGASAWFSAARLVDPSLELGADLAGPLQTTWNRAQSNSAPLRLSLPRPAHGSVFIDGTASDARPAAVPYLFQYVDKGHVEQVALLQPQDALPEYPTFTLLPSNPALRKQRLALGAGSAGVISAGCLVAATSLRVRFNNPSLSYREVERLIVPNRIVGGAGVAFGALALGLGTAATVEVKW